MKSYPNELVKSIKIDPNKFKLFESNSWNCIKKTIKLRGIQTQKTFSTMT